MKPHGIEMGDVVNRGSQQLSRSDGYIDRKPTNIRLVSDGYPTDIRQISDEYPTDMRRICDRYRTDIERISDGSDMLAYVWRIGDNLFPKNVGMTVGYPSDIWRWALEHISVWRGAPSDNRRILDILVNSTLRVVYHSLPDPACKFHIANSELADIRDEKAGHKLVDVLRKPHCLVPMLRIMKKPYLGPSRNSTCLCSKAYWMQI